MKSYLCERHLRFSHMYPWNLTPTLVNTAHMAVLVPVTTQWQCWKWCHRAIHNAIHNVMLVKIGGPWCHHVISGFPLCLITLYRKLPVYFRNWMVSLTGKRRIWYLIDEDKMNEVRPICIFNHLFSSEIGGNAYTVWLNIACGRLVFIIWITKSQTFPIIGQFAMQLIWIAFTSHISIREPYK